MTTPRQMIEWIDAALDEGGEDYVDTGVLLEVLMDIKRALRDFPTTLWRLNATSKYGDDVELFASKDKAIERADEMILADLERCDLVTWSETLPNALTIQESQFDENPVTFTEGDSLWDWFNNAMDVSDTTGLWLDIEEVDIPMPEPEPEPEEAPADPPLVRLNDLSYEDTRSWCRADSLAADGFVKVILLDGRRVTINDQGVFIDTDDTDAALTLHEVRWEDLPKQET